MSSWSIVLVVYVAATVLSLLIAGLVWLLPHLLGLVVALRSRSDRHRRALEAAAVAVLMAHRMGDDRPE